MRSSSNFNKNLMFGQSVLAALLAKGPPPKAVADGPGACRHWFCCMFDTKCRGKSANYRRKKKRGIERGTVREGESVKEGGRERKV